MRNKQKLPRRSITEWRALINKFDRSGQSVPQFCKSQGIAVSSLYPWRARSADELADDVITETSAPSFIDLSDLRPSNGGWSIVLKLGNGVDLSLNQVYFFSVQSRGVFGSSPSQRICANH